MLRRALFLYLCLCVPAWAHATSADMKVSGNKIVTLSGNCPIFFKGANVPSMEWLNTPDGPSGSSNGVLTTIQTMVGSWGANIVRVPLNQDRWLGTACGATAATYQGYVDQIVNWCNTNNVYVILDLHWSDTGVAGGGNVCSSGQHDMPDNNSSTFWTSVATRYANNPAVWFDLYNEPKGITSWTEWRNGGTAQTDGSYNSPGMQGLVTVIRNTGANNIIVAGGLDWAFNLTGVPANALTDTASGHGIVYATHIYPWKASPCTQAGGCFDNAVPASMRNAYAVMVTEFGQDNNANGVPNNSWSQSVMDWAKANTNGYVAWCAHTGATPNLFSDWNYTPTGWFGTTVKADMLATSAGGCVGTPTFTSTVTRTATRTATLSPVNTASFTPTRTATSTPPNTASSTATRTPSSSATATRTATPSATQSPANTPTFSPTATASRSATASSTQSPANSPTFSPTATPSRTATASSTQSPASTPTFSPTATPSRSATASSTQSPVNSPTPTGSQTPSRTATLSATESPVASPTLSGTPSATRTATLSATLSPANSASPTLTPSSTQSPVASPTLSGTPSATRTATLSATLSPANSASPTPTPSATQSPVASPTLSGTPSATRTATLSATRSPANSATPTATSSATPSPASSATPSATPSASGTSTALSSLTPTPSATPLSTAVASPTFTPLSTPAASPTASPAPTAPVGSGPPDLRRCVAFPNPGPRSLALELEGPADALSLRLYSRAEALVYALDGGPAPAGWSRLALPAGWEQGLANGVYFGVLQASRGGTKGRRALVKISLLR